MASSRFAAPTSELHPDLFLQRSWRSFAVALGVAAAGHLALVALNPFQEVLVKVPRPLTTRFIKREPRLTKPLELRKIPQPQRELIQREVQLARPRTDRALALASYDTRGLLGQVVSSTPAVPREARSVAPLLHPSLTASAIAGVRHPAGKVDLALEMLDIDAMDTGRYRAMVIQDPDDRQSLKGFVKMARIYSASAMNPAGLSGNHPGVLDVLAKALNWYTGIRAEILGNMGLDDERLLEVPFILAEAWRRDSNAALSEREFLSERELRNIAHYLKAGGFIFGRIDWTQALEKYGGLMQGQHFHYGRLPENHPIYGTFFDMGPNGVPLSTGGGHSEKTSMATSTYLIGLWMGERLAALEYPTPHGIGMLWWGVKLGVDNTRMLHLATNVVINALTQEGSLTQRMMQMVK